MSAYQRLSLWAIGFAVILAAGCSQQERPRPLTAQEIRGQRLFQATCATCHRTDSTQPLNGPGMKGIMRKPFMPSGMPANDERLRELFRTGRKTMPSYAAVLDDRQMDDIIAYLRTL